MENIQKLHLYAFIIIISVLLLLLLTDSSALNLALATHFVFSSLTQSVVFLRRGISPSLGRYQHAWQHRHNKHALASCQHWDSKTAPVFEVAKEVHALDGTATAIGRVSVAGAIS